VAPEPASSFQPGGTGVPSGHLALMRFAPVKSALVEGRAGEDRFVEVRAACMDRPRNRQACL
jgi:hypothetical protein